VPAPPDLDPREPRLWVALAAHLRPEQPIELVSAGGLLTLVTADGARYQAPRLLLHWHRQPLQPPLQVQRLVLGPLASYESAETVAARWRAAGAQPRIARPRDWEVWAAPGSPLPEGVQPRLMSFTLQERPVLEMRRSEGAVTLAEPLRLEAPGGLRWGGGVYAGPFRLQPDAHGGWTLLEDVPLERYLLGVVPHEIGAGSPPAALAAQAVLARTWALRNRFRFAVDGYHLCADTQCQVYSDPRDAGAAVRQAVRATAGQVLTAQGEPIHAVYHASNGGVSADEDEAWPLPELSYLEPALDLRGAAPQGLAVPIDSNAELNQLLALRGEVVGAAHPLFRWSRQLSQASLSKGLGARSAALGSPLKPVVLERGPSGRVVKLAIEGPGGRVVLDRDAIRRTYRQLPSTLFVLAPAGGGVWSVQGGGFGHGAGLSQAGAIDLAGRGWDLAAILRHYYPGARLQTLGAPAPKPPGGAP
jgi:SpoIID/LytB domain protein